MCSRSQCALANTCAILCGWVCFSPSPIRNTHYQVGDLTRSGLGVRREVVAPGQGGQWARSGPASPALNFGSACGCWKLRSCCVSSASQHWFGRVIAPLPSSPGRLRTDSPPPDLEASFRSSSRTVIKLFASPSFHGSLRVCFLYIVRVCVNKTPTRA